MLGFNSVYLVWRLEAIRTFGLSGRNLGSAVLARDNLRRHCDREMLMFVSIQTIERRKRQHTETNHERGFRLFSKSG